MLYINYLLLPFSKSLGFSIYFSYFYRSVITSYNTSHIFNNMNGMLDDDDDNDVLIISAHFERIMYKNYGLQVDDTRKLVQDFLDISKPGKYKVR